MGRRSLRRLPNRVLAVLIGLVSLVAAPPARGGGDLLIENVTLLSPELPQPLGNRHVLVRDGRIAGVSAAPPAGELPAGESGLVRLDGSGKYLTPGLMDSHVHVSEAPGLPPGSTAGLAALAAAYVRQQPRSYLYHGVTQLLDPSNAPAAVAAFEAQPLRPDLFRCGAAPVLDGYPSVFAEPPERYRRFPDFLVEPANLDPLPPGSDPAAHTPEAVVARIQASGARCVKLFIEDGFGDATGWPLPTPATLERVMTAARSRGLLVLAHANALDMQRLAVTARVDVIAHGLWNWTGHDGATGVPAAVAEHLGELHARGIGQQPTLRVVPGLRNLFRPDTLDDPAFARVVPAPLLAWYRTPAAGWFKEVLRGEMGGAGDDRIAGRLAGVAERALRALRHLYELGHPLLLASDTPSGPTYANQPGYNTYQEILLMAQAGIPLSEIFRAGTLHNARQFGLEGDYGTIEPGKVANLLLLEANPLAEVTAWDRIDTVILHGRAIPRQELAAP